MKNFPEKSPQKFSTSDLFGGCRYVTFYNRSDHEFEDYEVALMIKIAQKHFTHLPSHFLEVLGDQMEWQVSLVVDIRNDSVSMRKRLRLDNGIGESVSNRCFDRASFERKMNAQYVCRYLRLYASDYWSSSVIPVKVIKPKNSNKV